MAINLFFARHGESEKNVLKMHSCSLEKHPLTVNGRLGVEESVKQFNQKIDVIIVSPLLRALETAEIFRNKLQAPVIINELLAEVNFGLWNDELKEELLKKSELYRQYRTANPEEKIKFKAGEHGESREDVVERTRKFLKMVIRDYQDKNILVVAHGCTYAALMMILHGCNPTEYFEHENIGHSDVREFTLKDNLQV